MFLNFANSAGFNHFDYIMLCMYFGETKYCQRLQHSVYHSVYNYKMLSYKY